MAPFKVTEDSFDALDDGDVDISHHLSHRGCYLHYISAPSLKRLFDIFVEAYRFRAE
jgi:hypothetical protein